MQPPFNRNNAEREIREALQCPIDWGEVFRVESPASFDPLDDLWHKLLSQHVRGDESLFVGPDFLLSFLSDESDDELRAMLANVSLWKKSCHDEFRSKLRRFTELRHASRDDYAKHLPPRGRPRDPAWIDKESAKRGNSVFYCDIPEDDLLTAFLHGVWSAFSDADDFCLPGARALWHKLLDDDVARVAFRCSAPIGASGGQPTEYICYELEAATPIVHGYPVAEAEARRILYSCSITTVGDLREWGRP
jgi:hypothetical protein